MTSDTRNSYWLSIQYISTLVFSFVGLKLNFVHFGSHLFGLWTIFASVWGVSTSLDFGFGTALIKFIASANQSGEKLKINRITSTGFFLFVILGVVLFLVGMMIGELAFFNNPNIVEENLDFNARFVFIFLGFAFYCQYVSIFFRSLFEGFNNYVLSSRLLIVYNFMILFSIIIISTLKLNLVWLSFCYFLSSFILMVLCFAYMKISQKDIKISFSLIDYKEAKVMFGFSLSVQFASVFGVIVDPVIKYIIGNFYSVSAVAFYEIARKFSLAISGLFFNAFRNILPKVSILEVKGDYKNYLENDGTILSKFGVGYAGIMLGVLSIFLIPVIRIWFGSGESIIFYLLLCLPESINIIGFMVYVFLIGIAKAWLVSIAQALNLVIISVGVVLGLLVFKDFFGLLGYYISAVTVNILLLYFAKKETGFSILKYFKSIKIYKLIIFHALLILNVVLISRYNFNVFIMAIENSVVSFIIFYGELKEYGYLAYSKIMSFINHNRIKSGEAL